MAVLPRQGHYFLHTSSLKISLEEVCNHQIRARVSDLVIKNYMDLIPINSRVRRHFTGMRKRMTESSIIQFSREIMKTLSVNLNSGGDNYLMHIRETSYFSKIPVN